MQMMAFRPGWELERIVGAIFRTLGADVQHDVVIAGSQIDLLVRELTPSGSVVRIAVECKDYRRAVGVEIVNSFAALAILLKQRQLIDQAMLVARAGFTHHARSAAETHGITLLELADLLQRVSSKRQLVANEESVLDQEYEAAAHDPTRPKKLFVVMPFAPEFEDVYILGIREVAERLSLTVERADDIEHNENILETIQAGIRGADAIIADSSTANPNVFYEIGYAHGVDRHTILICRKGDHIPFDIQAKNLILYSSIVDLRERLGRRLRETLNL